MNSVLIISIALLIAVAALFVTVFIAGDETVLFVTVFAARIAFVLFQPALFRLFTIPLAARRFSATQQVPLPTPSTARWCHRSLALRLLTC